MIRKIQEVQISSVCENLFSSGIEILSEHANHSVYIISMNKESKFSNV